jgi:hypothetical protein
VLVHERLQREAQALERRDDRLAGAAELGLRLVDGGVARHLENISLAHRGAIIGFDTRFASEDFAAAAAEVLAAHKIHVYLFESAAATPVACHAILDKKAAGAIVSMKPQDFEMLVAKIEQPLVVRSRSKFFGERHHYLVGHKGLAFYTKAREQLRFPGKTEFIEAKSIWIPG